jgi:HAE1 family hydrophobic/amphiphilic exporter-1
VSELVRDAQGPGWWWLTVAPLAYLLVRFALHLIFDLLGKVGRRWRFIALVAAGRRPVVGGLILGTAAAADLVAVRRVHARARGGVPAADPLELAQPGGRVRAGARGRAGDGVGAPQLDSELIPELHQGEFTVEVSLPVGTPLPITAETMAPIEQPAHPRDAAPARAGHDDRQRARQQESGERGEHTTRLRVTLTRRRRALARAEAAKTAEAPRSEAGGGDGDEDRPGDGGARGAGGGAAAGRRGSPTRRST